MSRTYTLPRARKTSSRTNMATILTEKSKVVWLFQLNLKGQALWMETIFARSS